MALDREKALREAERLFKAGKAPSALAELRRMASGATRDLTILNRIGDLLLRYRQVDEAISYYERIATHYGQNGFYPKAIAIYKKIHRLKPDETEILVRVGDLYLQQRLPGEARTFLLHAADRHLAAGAYDRALAVFRKLVTAEPEDPRHRARLAETLAASGEREAAGEELLALAASLRPDEHAGEREKIFRRAAELLPDRIEPVVGVAESLAARERAHEGIAFLEERRASLPSDPRLLGELAALQASAGRLREAIDGLAATALEDVPQEVVLRVLGAAMAADRADEAWSRIDPRLEAWSSGDRAESLVALLERCARLEPDGHAPALDRIAAHHERHGDSAAASRAIERLLRALGARSDAEETRRALERLRGVAPDSPLLRSGGAESRAAREDDDATPGGPEPTGDEEPEPAAADVPLAFEAPAVPLSRSDEEFVSGRLTQAEILEKYGLSDKALQQVLEVVERFPGHVDAQERRVRLHGPRGDGPTRRDGLIGLALARRAAGDAAGARQAVLEARDAAEIPSETAGVLVALALLERREVAPRSPASAPSVAAAPPARNRTPKSAPSDEVVIDFDAAPAEREEPDAAADRLEDPGESLDRIAEEELPDAPVRAAAEPSGDADEDLSALAAALESELFVDREEAPIVPEAATEQTLEEVFDAFRKHVKNEVEDGDFRTHYELGIAYMEMGLLDEAVDEFLVASESPELLRESCIMIAMCHRQRGAMHDAAAWYRKALDSPGADRDAATGLRYDLAEVLEQAGESEAALDLYRDVRQVDPTFRDVQSRVDALEDRLRA